jgi:hypothetical protein
LSGRPNIKILLEIYFTPLMHNMQEIL